MRLIMIFRFTKIETATTTTPPSTNSSIQFDHFHRLQMRANLHSSSCRSLFVLSSSVLLLLLRSLLPLNVEMWRKVWDHFVIFFFSRSLCVFNMVCERVCVCVRLPTVPAIATETQTQQTVQQQQQSEEKKEEEKQRNTTQNSLSK